jgi:hypothetical protein
MVEEQSVAFQETIRDLLLEMGPEQSATFMELLNKRLSKIKNPASLPTPSVDKISYDMDRMITKGETLDGDLEEIGHDSA